MDDLLSEFLTETNESLQVLDTELVKLEQNPDSPELLDNIFRVMHTIKGTCGFLGLPRLENVAHAGETVLGKVRDGSLEITAERVTIVLECLDTIRDILAALEQTEQEPEGDDADLIRRLEALVDVAEGGDGATGEASAAGDQAGDAPDQANVQAEPQGDPAADGAAAHAGGESAEEGGAAGGPATGQDLAVHQAAQTPPAQARQQQTAPEPHATQAQPCGPAGGQGRGGSPGGGDGGGGQRESQVAAQSIRVSVDLLETLMTTVSELVLNRNQLLQILRKHRESEFAAPLQRLNHVVSELQEGVMKTRMQPIGNAWSKLPRLVRDLSKELGKKIDLRMKGEETELDRQVLELIKDPLTHMVRNSADHGMENLDERRAVGKPETGTISLNAFHEGGHIIIEIADDGRGLNVDKIKAKAIRNGLTTEAEAAGLSEQQIQQFIFKPGFSTADQVSAVSGRGVGMDVVRTNIEQIGGTIELSSKAGAGTKFTVKIPLTLAIVSALIVECAGERFAIPQLAVVELVRAKGGSENAIERIKDTPVLRLRDRLLPLVNLRELLRLDELRERDKLRLENANGHAGEDAAAKGAAGKDAGVARGGASEDTDGFIVVSQVGTYSFGIIVDQVYDTEEIVVKPVAKILRNIPLFSGNTILGDGRVVMILDPNGVASASGEITLAENEDIEAAKKTQTQDEDKVAMLVFKAVDKAPKAVPLALVARLEEVDLADVEYSNGQRVVQYRGQLMPLIQMEGAPPLGDEGKQPVLVFSDRDRTMGLVVDEIVDIVEDAMHVELTGDRPGCLGSAVIGGKATDIIDAGYYLTQTFSDWFRSDASVQSEHAKGKRVLLVDDSPFFRNLLTPLLDVAGYEVTPVESADAALKLCDEGHDFDVIVSDIEMPGMSGYELAETLRSRTRWSRVPLVALSSHATARDMERGRAAGFHDYVAKFDRETLLDTLHEMLSEDYTETRGAA